MPRIQQWMESTRPDPAKLVLTGHSLGAALATLAATVWRPNLLVTLGSPRVGDATFAATLSRTKVVRLVDCCDGVTDVPLEVGGYVHASPSTYLTRQARIIESPSAGTVFVDRLVAHLLYALRYMWRWRSVLVRSFADHAPINYSRAIFP
jgi:hypothetical protein